MTELIHISAQKLHGGWHKRFQHHSISTSCQMTCSIFIPPQVESRPDDKYPVVYCLAGLTCTDENFAIKSGAQKRAAELGLILVMPDTSPRGEGVPNDKFYGLGQGAGFYINATQDPWDEHFYMYDYIVQELPELIEQHFPASSQRALMGHSMGGHGALMIALKNPERYTSCSAFAPIVNPCEVPWGQTAFTAYLGDQQHHLDKWQAYDSCHLMRQYQHQHKTPMLIDQGLADEFIPKQLQLQKLMDIAAQQQWPIIAQFHEGYDHSYYFISSMIDKHLRFHAQHLG